MRKNYEQKILIFILILAMAFLVIGCGKDEPEKVQETYEIVVDNTVEIIYGEQNRISPHLIDSKGNIVESRFDYISSSDKISIDFDGNVTWTEFPKEDITLTVSERNTGTKKTITLTFIVEELTNVTTITGSDGKAIEAINGMAIGENITLNVISNLGVYAPIESYCFVTTTDEQGQSKVIFEPTFSNNQITLRAVGFGKGTLTVEIKDALEKSLYVLSIPYSIDLKDDNLTNRVLADNNATAIGQVELSTINTVRIDGTIKNISALSFFEALKTVVLETNEVLTFDGVVTSCVYRVPAELYNLYFTSSEWSKVCYNLIPYDASINERYVIYHSDKVEVFSYCLIDNDFVLQTFEHEKYVNVGWKDVNGISVTDDEVKSSEQGMHLFAEWEVRKNRVIFHGNGATQGSMEDQLIFVDASSALKNNQFVKAGYTFVGWSVTINGTVAYTDGATYTMDVKPEHDLYAVWAPNMNTIVYDANGGNGTMATQSALTDETISLSKNQFTRSGYVFGGWSTIPTGTAKYSDKAQYVMGADAISTLYAVWIPNMNGINYYANGGSGTMATQSVLTDETVFLSKNQFTKTGYTFVGWATTANGSVEYTDQAQYTMGSNSIYVLYAVWTPTQYSITYNLAGGTDISNPKQYNIESDKITLIVPTRLGYVFAGWIGEGITNPTKDVSIPTGSVGDKTYTAVWAATLYFHVNGGEGAMASVTVINNTSDYVLPKHTYIRDGYIFDGWSLSASGSIAYEMESVFICGEDGEYHLYAVWADGTEGLSFERNGSGYTVMKYTGNIANVKIPSMYRGKYVTSIADKAFYKSTVITSITIPDSINSIGADAFSNCTCLTSVYYDGIVADWCNISFDSGSSNPVCYAKKLYLKNSSGEYELLTELVIPNTVTEIKEYAFYNCDSITSITIPDSVKSIGNSAFYNCDSITSITIPDSVTSIGYWSFYRCDSLTTITIPTSVMSIDNQAFINCISLTSVYYDGSVVDWCNISFGDYYSNPVCGTGKLYLKNSNGEYELLTELVIPNSVTEIKAYAFYNCDSLTSVTIPDSVTNIGGSAFSDCNSITNITIPDSVTSIGSSSFRDCDSLTSVTIGNSVTSIGDGAFEECDNLVRIMIPDSVTSIGASAFRDCNSLMVIEIGNSVTSIGRYAFYNCDSLTSVTIPDSVTSISYSAFYDCDSLTNVIIGNSVTSIGDCAFYSCISLTSVTIGKSVTSIGYSAFENCNSLTSVTIPDSVTSISYSAFYNCDSLMSVTIGNSVTSIGSSAFKDCDSLTSVTIGNSVTSIGASAFYGCISLKNITIPASVTSIGNSAFSDCDSLVEVINKSSLNIVKGSSDYGDVAKYALEVHNGDSKIVNKDGYLFYTYDGVNYLVKYIGAGTQLVLPENYNGENYEIHHYAFRNYDSITSVTMSGSATSIGNYSFEDCDSLMHVTISGSVTSIGDEIFRNCDSLISVTIGNSVTSIGDYAFSNCDSIKSITVDEDNSVYKSMDGNLYTKDGKLLIKYAIGKNNTSFAIPDGVTSINYSAFEDCSNLTSIIISDSVRVIGNYAFYNCDNITSVTIPDSVSIIGAYAFDSCVSLTSVTIENSVMSIGRYAFCYCTKLTSVTFKNANGWEAGTNSISTTALADTSTAATYLKSTYASVSWTRK